MSPRRQQDPDAKIKYLVSEAKGEYVLELPADWKVTFSHVNPAAVAQGHREGYCLRVWEGEKLRAVFSNVTGIRDMAIPLARKVERQTGSAQWTMDSEGNFEDSRTVEVERAFILESGDDTPF